jgi:Sulfotransferase family
MPRSGTTMTEQIIASHSQVEGVGELDRMARLDLGMARGKGMQGILDKMSEVGPDNWNMVCLQYLNLVNALAPDAMRTVDKMPQNFISLGFIHLCFPNAKIIHCKRNPLDNFISAYQNAMNSSHDYAYDQVAYGKYYIKYLELMDHWKVVIPSNIYESQYEKLTANPETEVRKMLEFLGLPWEEACLKFNERKSTVRTFSSLQVRNPINTSSVARWRNYEKYLGPIRSILDDAGISYQN